MLPSPGFSIPSIGTPLHQPEEDQQIIANNPYFNHGATPSSSQMMSVPMGGSSGMTPNAISNSGMSGNDIEMPSIMNTPSKMSSYQPSYATPQSLMQPQTPVS